MASPEATGAPPGDALTGAMVGIGMLFAAPTIPDQDIEETIFAASQAGMDGEDFRTLGILVDWLDVHVPWLNEGRLLDLMPRASGRVRAFWAAFAQRHGPDARFSPLVGLAPPGRCDVFLVGTDFQLRRRGEDPRFQGTALRVPAGTLRHRPADVLHPEALIRQHRAYRWRVLMGPTHRADMWAALEAEPTLEAPELARQTRGPLDVALRVIRDFALVSSAQGPRVTARAS